MAVFDALLGRLLYHKHKAIPDTVMFGFFASSQGANLTRYFPLNERDAQTSELATQTAIFTGKFTKLKVYVVANIINGATTIGLRVNGENTALIITIPAGADGIFDVKADVSVNEGDKVTFCVSTGGSSGTIMFSPSLVFQPS